MGTWTKKRLKGFLFFSLSIVILFSFQNCGSQFQVTNQEISEIDLASMSSPQISLMPSADLVSTAFYSIEYSVTGISPEQIKSTTCQLGTSTPVDCSKNIYTATGLTDGDYKIAITVETITGIKSEASKIFRKDSTAPVINIIAKPAAITNQVTTSISFLITDNLSGVDSVMCSLDSAEFATCVSPLNITNLAQGSHSLKIKALDKAKNSATIASVDWVTDLTVPSLAFLQMPANPTNLKTAQFNFSGSGIVQYECQLDNAAFTNCQPPIALAALTAGTHNFKVRGTTAAGNVSTPISFAWTVDLEIPVITFSQTPSAITNSTTATFSFSGTNASSYECQLDGAAYSSCLSGKSYTGLAAGNHTLNVRGTSAAGNVSNPISFSWKVDLAAPSVTLSQMPSPITNQTTATFSFSSSDSSATFECQLDGAAYSACTSPKVYSALASKSHNFQVRGKSAVGNLSTPVSFSWVVDLSIPSVTISQKPDLISAMTAATFIFSSSSQVSFECQLDGTGYTPCSSPKVYSNLSSTVHKFNVRGTSVAGNISQIATSSWTIDAVVPTVKFDTSPDNITSDATASFKFSGTNATRFECQLGSAAFSNCTSPISFTGLGNGNHMFSIRSFNSANLVSSVVTRNWVVDLILPSTPPLTTSTTPISNSNSVSFSFSSSDANGIQKYLCDFNGTLLATCTSPMRFSNLRESYNFFEVTAVDNAGNRSLLSRFEWFHDSVAPSVPVLNHYLDGLVTSRDYLLTSFQSSDVGGSGINSYRCLLDNRTIFNPCPNSLYLENLPNGAHLLEVVAIDKAGNVSAPVTLNWTVNFDVFTELSGNYPNICGLTDKGTVVCSGTNAYGQIGNGSRSDDTRYTKGTVAGLTGIKAISTGEHYSCALTATGTVKCWGSNLFGSLGNGSNMTYSLLPVDVLNISGAKAISSTGGHTCIITATDTVKCWGENTNGQLGNGLKVNSPIAVDVLGLVGVKSIQTGDRSSCAITNTGNLKCWGAIPASSPFQVSAVPTDASNLTNLKSACFSMRYACVIGSDDKVQCWGDNSVGQLGIGTRISSASPVNVMNLDQVKSISCKSDAACVVLTSGEVRCWGSGSLGNTATIEGSVFGTSLVPITYKSKREVNQSVITGVSFTCALTDTGRPSCYGNAYGEL